MSHPVKISDNITDVYVTIVNILLKQVLMDFLILSLSLVSIL